MKKLVFIFALFVVSLSGCTRDLSKYIDVYFLQGADGDVLLLDFEKYVKEYPKTVLPETIKLNGKLFNGNDVYAEFNAVVKTGFKYLYSIHLLRIENPEELNLVIDYFGIYTKKMSIIVENTKEKYNFALLNNVESNKTSDGIEFVMQSIRIKENSDEFIPNSNSFEIDIKTDKGQRVFNSAIGKNYLQMINPVHPEKVGDVQNRIFNWDLKSNDGKKVGKGLYQVQLMIPSKPKPYIEKLDIKIE